MRKKGTNRDCLRMAKVIIEMESFDRDKQAGCGDGPRTLSIPKYLLSLFFTSILNIHNFNFLNKINNQN
jgi:hypothetical protein